MTGCSGHTHLQVQQQTLCNQSETGPVRGEEDQSLFLKEAGKYLQYRKGGRGGGEGELQHSYFPTMTARESCT